MSKGIINPKGRLNLNETSRDLTIPHTVESDESLKNWLEKIKKNRKLDVTDRIKRRIKEFPSLEHSTAMELLYKGIKPQTVLDILINNFSKKSSTDTLAAIVMESQRILFKICSTTS